MTIRTLTGISVMEWIEYFILMATDEMMLAGQKPGQFYKQLGFNDVRDFVATIKSIRESVLYIG